MSHSWFIFIHLLFTCNKKKCPNIPPFHVKVHYFDLIQANLLKRLREVRGGMFSSITHILRSSDLNTARSGKNTTMLLREKVRDKRGCEDFHGRGRIWDAQESEAGETERERNHVRQHTQRRRPGTILDEGLSIHLSSLWPLLTPEESCRSAPF